MQKRYQVFVSSTYIDLKTERNEVVKALLELDCIPCGMEYFPAASEDQWTYIKSLIDHCDYYVVIIGGRYGSISEEGISYTQREYEYALEQEIPIIAFIHRHPENLPVKFTEATHEGKQRLDAFLGLVKSKLCKEWENPYELGAVVSRSVTQLIRRHPRTGWVRADSSMSETSALEVLGLTKQIKALEDEIIRLKGQQIEGSELLAQDDEEIDLTISYSVLAGRRGEGWDKVKVDSYNVKLTWNELFKATLSNLQNPSSESSVRGRIGSYIFSREVEKLNRKHEPNYVERVNLDRHSFQIIKVQFSALGLIEVTTDSSGKRQRKLWRATPLGMSKMYDLLAVKKGI